jgi:hypothetical protein
LNVYGQFNETGHPGPEKVIDAAQLTVVILTVTMLGYHIIGYHHSM